MTETPQEFAARAARVLAKCRERGQATLADVENLANGIRNLAGEYESLMETTVELKAVVDGLTDEYGILDHGGGLRHPTAEPIPLRTWNAALFVELRAKGIFDDGSRRPALLMQRKATGWSEIPFVTTPDDIFPGYSEQKSAAAREVND